MDKKKILVVDDEKHWRNLFRSFLKDYNFEIFEAFDGQSGIGKAKEIQPDIIILDNKMPNMTGLEAVKVLRSTSLTKSIPIIMATAMDFTDSMVEYIKLDVHDFIKKPFDVKDFIEKIEKITGPVTHTAQVEAVTSEKIKILSCFENKENSDFAYSKIQSKQNYNIDQANNSAELLEKATKNRPDVILTGASNAGWSGYMGVKLLHNSLLKDIPIVIDVADVEAGELSDTLKKSNKRYFIIKPIESRELENHIRKLKEDKASDIA